MKEIDWKQFLLDDHAEIKRLDYVVRYNSIPALFQESVSQHSFWVTLYSCLLHNKISGDSGSTYSELRILKKSLTHDIGECVSGDLVRTFKYSSPEFKRAVDMAEETMVEKYLPLSIKNLIKSSQSQDAEDEEYENAIVKAADFISLFHFMYREHNRGNREITPFLNRMRSDMNRMAEKAYDGSDHGQILSGMYKSMVSLVLVPEENREV